MFHEIAFNQGIADALPLAFGCEEAVVPHDLEVVRDTRDTHVQTLGYIRDARFFNKFSVEGMIYIITFT